MININFVNTGADEAILKSMDTENCSEELVKAMNKQGLVQKEIQVKGKNGTFTRRQWVSAGGDVGVSNSNLKGKKTDDLPKTSTGAIDWDKMVQDGDFTAEQKSELSYGVSEKHACVVEKDGKIKTTKDWDEADYAEKNGWKNLGSVTEILKQGKLPTHTKQNTQPQQPAQPKTSGTKLSKEDAKKKTQEYSSKIGKSDQERKAFMEKVQAQGITWKSKNDDGTEASVAISWMRCLMAMNKHFADGGSFDDTTKKNDDSTVSSGKAFDIKDIRSISHDTSPKSPVADKNAVKYFNECKTFESKAKYMMSNFLADDGNWLGYGDKKITVKMRTNPNTGDSEEYYIDMQSKKEVDYATAVKTISEGIKNYTNK